MRVNRLTTCSSELETHPQLTIDMSRRRGPATGELSSCSILPAPPESERETKPSLWHLDTTKKKETLSAKDASMYTETYVNMASSAL